MTINANFDPSVQSELEWAAKQIKKVLEQTPEIKVLEKKLGMLDDVNDALEKSIAGLKKVVDFNKMILPESTDEENKEE
jgi:plasmid rolling circle replication initiator protein Rep